MHLINFFLGLSLKFRLKLDVQISRLVSVVGSLPLVWDLAVIHPSGIEPFELPVVEFIPYYIQTVGRVNLFV